LRYCLPKKTAKGKIKITERSWTIAAGERGEGQKKATRARVRVRVIGGSKRRETAKRRK